MRAEQVEWTAIIATSHINNEDNMSLLLPRISGGWATTSPMAANTIPRVSHRQIWVGAVHQGDMDKNTTRALRTTAHLSTIGGWVVIPIITRAMVMAGTNRRATVAQERRTTS